MRLSTRSSAPWLPHRRDCLRLLGAGMASLALPSFARAQAAGAIVQVFPNRPMALGLLIFPFADPIKQKLFVDILGFPPTVEGQIALVKNLGFSNCFLSMDGYAEKFSLESARQMRELLSKYGVTATAAETVSPMPMHWNFTEGPSEIGLVPRATREKRIDALKKTSDFAHLLGINRVQTHCGFIPEDPSNPLYEETVAAIRQVADYCSANGQNFLMETGQETPITMLRAIKDVDRPNLGVGLDTANLILYGKSNPVDAIKVLGPHIQSVHAKDGRWPTDPAKLGEEVLIGSGDVDFPSVFRELKALKYQGAITIEREGAGAHFESDVRQEKQYLDKVLAALPSA